MLLKKSTEGYYISGGLSWIPLLHGKIKTRKEINERFKDTLDKISYATDDFKPARLYEIGWWENIVTHDKYPKIYVDEGNYIVMEKPFASDEEITALLKERAKGEGKEAIIRFIEARPEQPAED